MQLSPGETYTVGYVIDNHTDPVRDSYYVRAVIRNARTFATLDTLNLTLAGSGTGIYTKDWQVPADTSGNGFYVTITITVYTDSGYTTKSDQYGEKMLEHLIQVRRNTNFGGGGGGWYPDKYFFEKLSGLMEEASKKKLAEALKLLPPPTPATDLMPVLDILSKMGTKVSDIDTMVSGLKNTDLPELLKKETDLSGVLAGLGAIRSILEAMPRFEKTDLSAIVSELASLNARLSKAEIEEAIAKIPELNAAMENIEKAMRDFIYLSEKRGIKEKPKVPAGYEFMFDQNA